MPSQPTALIWVEGPWPAAGGEAGGTLLPLESAFLGGEVPVSRELSWLPLAQPTADPVQEAFPKLGGEDAGKEGGVM